MDSNKRKERMRRGVMALRHQFVQGGNGVFANVLPAEDVQSVVSGEAGCYRDPHLEPRISPRPTPVLSSLIRSSCLAQIEQEHFSRVAVLKPRHRGAG